MTLSGPNDFLRQAALGEMRDAFVREHTDMALEQLDGEEAAPARMAEAMQSLPFLTARKLVILREPGKQKTFAEHIETTLKTLPETTDLIIIEPKPDKRTAYYKTLKKHTDFKEFNELDAGGLARWLVAQAKAAGATLSAPDAGFLVERVGINQQLLKNELDKLLLDGPNMTRQTIQDLVEPMPQSTIFELIDAAFKGQTAHALALYEEQRALKVEPQAIIALLAWQLHVLAVVKAAGDRTPDDIAKTAKLNPYVVRKTSGLARGLSLERIKTMVSDLLTLDIKTKTTAIDADEATKLFILNLAHATKGSGA